MALDAVYFGFGHNKKQYGKAIDGNMLSHDPAVGNTAHILFDIKRAQIYSVVPDTFRMKAFHWALEFLMAVVIMCLIALL